MTLNISPTATNTVIVTTSTSCKTVACTVSQWHYDFERATTELEHIDSWSKHDNLTLNCAKTLEVIFADKKSKRTVTLPPPLPGITRRTTFKILGVTITSGLSIAEHIQGVITSCSQTLHALRVLRAHGMPPSVLHEVIRAVVITKLCYASSAWWGFSAAGDIQRITALISRSIRQGYFNSDHADITSIINTADDTLFRQILTNPYHVYFLKKLTRITNSDPGSTIVS